MERPKELSEEMAVDERGNLKNKSKSRRLPGIIWEGASEKQLDDNIWVPIEIKTQHLPQIIISTFSSAAIKNKSISVNPQKVSDFYEYTKKWKNETAHLSAPNAIRMNKYYHKIIGLGSEIIPLILQELKKESNDWLYALSILTKEEENPTNEKMGFKDCVRAWLNWGEQKRLI